ncbi:MAG TPA: shikimate kinase [Pyrinomonadaceae bacterium]|jgi:shikimate kinase|nr:shikimate kinase [Pyrinomonadaceae bacterium]
MSGKGVSRAARRVLLTGFMGAGKTTVARALAGVLGARSADLDDLVAAREGRTARRLIDEDGEPFFRDAETRALEEALGDEGVRVIATGGGALTFERNRALAEAYNCLTVWLDAPFGLCWRRAQTEDDSRPFARDESKARELYERRRAAYALAALRVRVEPDSTPEQLAREIAHALAD